jgi:hypothetical protein
MEQNERPHRAAGTRALLEHFNWELFDHSYSHNLTSSCCHLFTHLKNRLRSRPFDHNGELKLKLIYDRQSVGQSVLVPGTHQGPVTNFFSLLEVFFRQLGVCYFVAPSLTRGWVCNLL